MTSYLAATLLGVALILNFLSSAIAKLCSKTRIVYVVQRNILSFSPRQLGGRGSPGSSPIYGAMWTTIYFLTAGSVFVFVFIDGKPELETSAILAACSLALAAFWEPIFLVELPWSFAASATILGVVAILAVASAAIADPFNGMNGESPLYLYIYGLCVSILAGWASVATSIGVGLTVRVYSRGIGARPLKEERSLLPILLSVVMAVVSIVFANPLMVAPLIITCFFVPRVFSDWRIVVTLVISILAYAAAVLRVFL